MELSFLNAFVYFNVTEGVQTAENNSTDLKISLCKVRLLRF